MTTRQQKKVAEEAREKLLALKSNSPPATPQDKLLCNMKFEQNAEGNVPCIHFGPNRRTEYPGYFFCSNCDFLEREITSGAQQNIKTSTKIYCCMAHHDNFAIPTDLMIDTAPPGLCFRPNPSPNPTVNSAHGDEII